MIGPGTSKTEVRVDCTKSRILIPGVDYFQRVLFDHR
jgi:hypothetical protein